MGIEHTIYSYRLPLTLKRQLEACAARDRRSVAQLMTMILDGWLSGRPYEPSFDPASVAPRVDDGTTAPPGRPRSGAATAAADGVVCYKPAIMPILEGREAVTIDEIFEKTNFRNDSGTRKMLRELFLSLGWTERVETTGARIWIAPTD